MPLGHAEQLQHQPFQLVMDLSNRQRLPFALRAIGAIASDQFGDGQITEAVRDDPVLEEVASSCRFRPQNDSNDRPLPLRQFQVAALIRISAQHLLRAQERPVQEPLPRPDQGRPRNR